MRPEDIYDPSVVEQIIVSGAIMRQAEYLPPELVEQHKQILQGMGLMAEAVAAIPKEHLIALLDRVQERYYGEGF